MQKKYPILNKIFLPSHQYVFGVFCYSVVLTLIYYFPLIIFRANLDSQSSLFNSLGANMFLFFKTVASLTIFILLALSVIKLIGNFLGYLIYQSFVSFIEVATQHLFDIPFQVLSTVSLLFVLLEYFWQNNPYVNYQQQVFSVEAFVLRLQTIIDTKRYQFRSSIQKPSPSLNSDFPSFSFN